MPDPLFADPRLAALYDVLDNDRSDLTVYAGIVEELEASTVLDVGCGTGTLACMLARRGISVVGVEPAAASLDVARRKPGARRVHWIHADASSIPSLEVDLAVMTGNVAQVFVHEADWADALRAVRRAVRDGGWFVFETRDPLRRAWEHWTKEHTYRELHIPDAGLVVTWTELLDVQEPLVTFRHVFRFPPRVANSSRTPPFGSGAAKRSPPPLTTLVSDFAACGTLPTARRRSWCSSLRPTLRPRRRCRRSTNTTFDGDPEHNVTTGCQSSSRWLVASAGS